MPSFEPCPQHGAYGEKKISCPLCSETRAEAKARLRDVPYARAEAQKMLRSMEADRAQLNRDIAELLKRLEP